MRKSIFKSRSACSSLTVALALAATFNFSCSEDKDERFDYCITADGCLEGSFTASTCKGQLSNDCTGSPVLIGDQVWQKYNLNVAVNTGVNLADKQSKCYNDNTDYCDIYGGLYDWATAMDLPSGCNVDRCYRQVNSPHQGICPKGWHIPTIREWRVLENHVGGKSIAGKMLKANSTLWEEDGKGTGNYGFSALPGGEYRFDQPMGVGQYSFNGVGYYGTWWTAEEYNETYSNIFALSYSVEDSYIHETRKKNFQSVRCLKD